MGKLQKEMNRKKNNGITLIALVITIIVLLILAGVTIATLTGENGILTKAQEASEETKKANAEEQVKIAVQASYGTDGKMNLDDLNNELKKIEGLTYKGNPISDDNRIESLPATVNVDGYDVEIKGEGETGNRPTIPEGFYPVEGTTVEGGFVISDVEGDDLNNSAGGNQYVWIPVDGILGEKGKTVQNAVDGEIILGRYVFDSNGDIDTALTPTTLGGELKTSSTTSDSYTETSTGNGNTVAKDIDGFIDSVRTNGGYYIARFEASQNTTTNKAESKYNKTVWNSITQPNAAKACQELYEGVNSDLVNSYAWDTAILFIQKYSGDEDYSRQVRLQSSLANTGKATDGTNYDVRCNIYDMAGNCREWTTETYSYSDFPCVSRGGDYDNSFYYTSRRSNDSTSHSVTNYSFRPLLYL